MKINQQVEYILTNIALRYPKTGYYQGMNYIAIFLLQLFEGDAQQAYWLFCHVSETYLQEYLDSNFSGLAKLIFLLDKTIQRLNHSMWITYQQANFSSIHFGVSPMITLFCSILKNETPRKDLILKFWDLFLVGGFYNGVKAVYATLKAQEIAIYKLTHDEVLIAHQRFERDPFCVAKASNWPQNQIDQAVGTFTKKAITQIDLSEKVFNRMKSHYNLVHQPILEFWSEN